MTPTPQHESISTADLPTDAPTSGLDQRESPFGPIPVAPATSARTGWTPAAAAVVAAAATFAVTLAGFGAIANAYRAGLADSGHHTGLVRVEGGTSVSHRGERTVPGEGGGASSERAGRTQVDPQGGSSSKGEPRHRGEAGQSSSSVSHAAPAERPGQ